MSITNTLQMEWPQFSIDFFKENPKPFYLLSKEIMPQPEKYKPTPTHFFMKLLEDEGILRRVYTQNIDCLERVCGISAERLVECHGTYAKAACIGCKRSVSINVVREGISKSKVVRCSECGSLVKPDITFFGEALPPRFAEMKGPDEKAADLLIVMGTSLKVYPVAGLVDTVSSLCPRVLINMEAVHVLEGEKAGEPTGNDPTSGAATGDPSFRFDLKDNYRDVLLQGACDAGVRKLCELIGEGFPKKLQALIDGFDAEDGASRIAMVEEKKESGDGKGAREQGCEDVRKDTRGSGLHSEPSEEEEEEEKQDKGNGKGPQLSDRETAGCSELARGRNDAQELVRGEMEELELRVAQVEISANKTVL